MIFTQINQNHISSLSNMIIWNITLSEEREEPK
jgi:hypothetical protein